MEAIYNAGYYSQYLWEHIPQIEKGAGIELPGQLRGLSTFSLKQVQHSGAASAINPTLKHIICLYKNLICRGLPTLPSLTVERALARTVSPAVHMEEIRRAGKFNFECATLTQRQEREWLSALARAHYPIDPRLSLHDSFDGDYDSTAEMLFHQEYLSKFISPALPFVTETQRKLDQILPDEHSARFAGQRVDFSIEIGSMKLTVEVDGRQHDNDEKQKRLDKDRDEALTQAGWKIFRISASDVAAEPSWQGLENLRAYLQSCPETALVEGNCQTPGWESEMGAAAMMITLAPIGIARLQRVLLEALQSGALQIDVSVWRIACIERDIGCAALAILDFKQFLSAFYNLMGISAPLPRVEMVSFSTPEFAGSVAQPTQSELSEWDIYVTEMRLEEFEQSNFPADVVLDHSLLAYQGYNYPGEAFYSSNIRPSGAIYVLRNAYHPQETRRLHSLEPMAYPTDQAECQGTVLFFLRNIFRKTEFRDGQNEILTRSLALKPVIGLLPTGAGKSICYQLSAMLQPGITFVVDPLISLMVDQCENLKSNYAIDWVGFISSVQSLEENRTTISRMMSGRYQILLVSPERFQSKTFREKLRELCLNYSVPYAVIDEAHCVSEWGHDFRTSYLKLASTIRANCKYKKKFAPAFIALTGTASFSVLSDVQRELGVEEETAKVYPSNFNRSELVFSAKTVRSENKSFNLNALLRKLPEIFNISQECFFQPNGQQTYAGIIFVPHTNGTYGAYKIFQSLTREYPSLVNYFSGEVPHMTVKNNGGGKIKKPVMANKEFREFKIKVQSDFKANRFSILVATKAYGMGIDKPNVRYVIHYNIPHSLEAYYQEAGRAGRDKEKALCFILFSDDKSEEANRAFDANATHDTLVEVGSGYDDGDIQRLIYLHQNAYKGQTEELNATSRLYFQYIHPRLQSSHMGEKERVRIPFGGDENQRMAHEKAIYRLIIIGVVEDYTVDYKANGFELTIIRRPDEDYISALKTYIQRYRTRELSEIIPEQVANQPGTTIVEQCLSFLISFVYEEIERKRRAAIRSMAEVARRAGKIEDDAEKDHYIRQELLAYLEHSPFTDELINIGKEIVPAGWHEVLQKQDDTGNYLLHTVDGVRQLLGGCRRALESYIDHPGLLFLSVLSRLLLPDPDETVIMDEFHRALTGLREIPEEKRTDALIIATAEFETWLRDVRDYKEWKKKFAATVLDEYPNRTMARHLVDVLPERCERILVSLTLERVARLTKNLLDLKPELTYEHEQYQ